MKRCTNKSIRSYQLAVQVTGHGSFPSQCTSNLLPGATLVFVQAKGADGLYTSTTSKIQSVSFVYGMHVNGFNVMTATTSTRSSVTSTATALSTTTSDPRITPPQTAATIASPSTSAAVLNASTKKALSGGAIAGLAIGIIVLLASLILGAWLIIRRWRNAVRRSELPSYDFSPPVVEKDRPQANSSNVETLAHEFKANGNARYATNNTHISELPEPESLHEMSGTPVVYR
jgi:hypothetical protein